MNERIQELMEQAMELVDPYAPEGDFGPSQLNAEKFAELIVKQCGYYADIFESLGCPVDMDPTETKPSDFIKRQFGVEE